MVHFWGSVAKSCTARALTEDSVGEKYYWGFLFCLFKILAELQFQVFLMKWKTTVTAVKKKKLDSKDLDSISPQDMQQLYVFKLSLELHSTALSPCGCTALFSLPGTGNYISSCSPIAFVPQRTWYTLLNKISLKVFSSTPFLCLIHSWSFIQTWQHVACCYKAVCFTHHSNFEQCTP